MERLSLREQQLRLREDVILQAVNSLLADKGFDLMTVDEVAALVGIAKASLYKHFPSKEALAAAALVRLLDRALEIIAAQPATAAPIDKLRAVTRWALREHLRGQMPTLPSGRSALREMLAGHEPYLDRLMRVSDALGAWIDEAQRDGTINPQLPAELVLYTLFARACDPVPNFMKLSGQYSDERIVDWVADTCFHGLAARPN